MALTISGDGIKCFLQRGMPCWGRGGCPVLRGPLPSRASTRSPLQPAPLGAVESRPSPVDYIEWPDGMRPKRGGLTRAALARLRVPELRAQLLRLGGDGSGTKDQLAERLLQLVLRVATDECNTEDENMVDEGHLHHHQQSFAADAKQQQQPVVQELQPSLQHQKSGVKASDDSDAETKSTGETAQRIRRIASVTSGQQQMASAATEAAPGSTSTSQQTRHGAVVQPGTIAPLSDQEAAAIAAAVGIDLAALPPLQRRARGYVYDVADLPGLTPAECEIVLKSLCPGLAVTLLGGATARRHGGAPPCLALVRDKDTWLFDVGEDVQRCLLWREHIKPSKVHRIVITRQAPDAMLGLPGVLCVIGSGKEKGHEHADIPIHVYGPAGTADFLAAMYECSDTFLEMPVVVYEFVTHAVDPANAAPQQLTPRAKLWRVLVPPDQLNPLGWTDADLEAFMPTQGRARMRKGSRAAGGPLSSNPRAGHRPMPTPPPGDPNAGGGGVNGSGLRQEQLTWTIVADEAAMLTAVQVEAAEPSWAVVWREADRQGNISIPRCQALGLNDGASYADLKNGQSAVNDGGVTVPAGMVVSPDKPGRKLVLLPSCVAADHLGPHAAGADVLVAHAAAASAGGSSGSSRPGVGLGRCAQAWGVRYLVLAGLPTDSEERASSSSSSSSSGGGNHTSGTAADYDDKASAAVSQTPQTRVLCSEAAAVLSVVREQFTAGLALPAYDGQSLVVEENAGDLAPSGPPDLEERAALLRRTCLTPTEQPSAEQRERQRRASAVQHRSAMDARRMPARAGRGSSSYGRMGGGGGGGGRGGSYGRSGAGWQRPN